MMPSVKLDKVKKTSLFESFKNYATTTGDIVVAATSLANGASRTISVTIPYTRAGTIADIYATRSTVRTNVNTSPRAAASAVYSFASSETAELYATYSTTDITVSLVITNNTGGSITPTAQTLTISVVQYDAPITL